MSILPMKRCKQCDHIFKSNGISSKTVCPRCSSKAITDATKAEIKADKKQNK